jgi:hypothetical protein
MYALDHEIRAGEQIHVAAGLYHRGIVAYPDPDIDGLSRARSDTRDDFKLAPHADIMTART